VPDRQSINKQGLGRIVAAFKRDFAFICHGASRRSAIIHDAFTSPIKSRFQIAYRA
jgi:DNA-binding PucR family transcriptional regulator